jgi:hypothetical protein
MPADSVPLKYIADARQRAARRKSKWNLLLIPFAIIGAGLCWYFLIQLLLSLRVQFFPQDAFLMNGTRLGNIAMYVSPLFPSLGTGLILANLAVWMIPPARRALNEEAGTVAGTNFKSSNTGLAKFVILISIIAFPIAVSGATSYFYLTSKRIVYRSSLLAGERHYEWSDVSGIETACWYSRQNRNDSYTFVMLDGTRVGILESHPDFLRAYPMLTSALSGHSFSFSSREVAPGCAESLSPLWRKMLTRAPLLLEKAQ